MVEDGIEYFGLNIEFDKGRLDFLKCNNYKVVILNLF